MTKNENELNDYLLEQGWREGAASPERVASLLQRLSLKNRLAAVAFAGSAESEFESADRELFDEAA